MKKVFYFLKCLRERGRLRREVKKVNKKNEDLITLNHESLNMNECLQRELSFLHMVLRDYVSGIENHRNLMYSSRIYLSFLDKVLKKSGPIGEKIIKGIEKQVKDSFYSKEDERYFVGMDSLDLLLKDTVKRFDNQLGYIREKYEG